MKKTTLAAIALLLFSCSQPEQQVKNGTDATYFDLAGYFNGEANRLQAANPSIRKQVMAKGKAEVKNTKVTDWKTELASFTNADINKTSWRGEFSITKDDSLTTYITDNPKIPVKKLEVLQKSAQVIGIRIFKSSENALYDAVDTLIYFPDSIYIIKNQQKIKLLNVKNYEVIGKFN